MKLSQMRQLNLERVVFNSVIDRIVRKRRMWTPEEVNLLKKGVKRYGEGNWRRIQIRYLPERTNVMIKDKVRTMKFSKNPHDRKRIQKWIEYYSKQSKK